MYQSLMIYMHDFALMITFGLYSVSIESLESKLYYLNKAFNVEYLYPHLSINCYYQFALYYAKSLILRLSITWKSTADALII